MKRSQSKRADWEYAEGPTVGEDVPLTSPPREEEKPGVPKTPPPPDEPSDRGEDEGPLEEREVRVERPELSEDTNARLTEDLRDVVGAERIEVPQGRPHVSRGDDPPKRTGARAFLDMNRFVLMRNALILLVIAAILALATGSWWVLPLAAGLHALGTMVVILSAVGMTTVTERSSPTVAAAMSEEGVSSPDELFSDIVDEFRPVQQQGTSEVVSAGFNDRSADAVEDPLVAGAEQSSAWTPTGGPSQPAPGGDAPDALIWLTSLSLLTASILISAAFGGWMWLLTAVIAPLVVGWVVMQRMLHVRRGSGGSLEPRALVVIAISVVLAVVVFCVVVAFVFQHVSSRGSALF